MLIWNLFKEAKKSSFHTTRAQRRRQYYCAEIEMLEDRRLLTGDVTAALHSGELEILGDAADNQLQIASFEDGSVVLVGLGGTRINGVDVLILNGVNNGMDIRMSRGDDELYFGTPSGVINTIHGDISIQMGEGGNQVHFGQSPDPSGGFMFSSLVDIKGDISITNERGHGDVFLLGVAVEGSVFVDLGTGIEQKEFVLDRWGGQSDIPSFSRRSSISEYLNVTADKHSFGKVDIHVVDSFVGTATLETAQFDDDVTLGRVTFQHIVEINTGAGGDLILITDSLFESVNTDRVEALNIQAGGHADRPPIGQDYLRTPDTDTLLITGGQVIGDVIVETGYDRDEVDFIRPNISGSLTVDTGGGQDFISVGFYATTVGEIGGNLNIVDRARFAGEATDVRVSNLTIGGNTTMDLSGNLRAWRPGSPSVRQQVVLGSNGNVSMTNLTVTVDGRGTFLDLVMGRHSMGYSVDTHHLTIEATAPESRLDSPHTIRLLGGTISGLATFDTKTHALELEISDTTFTHLGQSAQFEIDHLDKLEISNSIFEAAIVFDMRNDYEFRSENSQYHAPFFLESGVATRSVASLDFSDNTFYDSVDLIEVAGFRFVHNEFLNQAVFDAHDRIIAGMYFDNNTFSDLAIFSVYDGTLTFTNNTFSANASFSDVASGIPRLAGISYWEFADNTFGGAFDFSLGGDDVHEVTFTHNTFEGDFQLRGGEGPQNVRFEIMNTFRGPVEIDLGGDDDTLILIDCVFEDRVLLFGGLDHRGDTLVSTRNLFLGGDPVIDGFEF